MNLIEASNLKIVQTNTVEPQSYGPHSYRILSQPDTDIHRIHIW